MAAIASQSFEALQSSRNFACAEPQLVPDLSVAQEPVYHAHGMVAVGKDTVRYTIAATESCDPSYMTILVNGLGGFKSSSRGWRDTNARDANEVTISFSPARNDGIKNNLFDPQRAQVEALACIVTDAKTNPDVQNLPNGDRIDFDRIRLTGQSLGGLPVARFAAEGDGRVEAATFIVSAGFNNGNALGHLGHVAVNLFDFLKADCTALLQSPHVGDGFRRNMLRMLKHNRRADRTAGELISALWSNISETVLALDAITCGIESKPDTLVPANSRLSEIVDYYKLANFGHLGPQINPKEVVAATVALHEQAGLR